MNRLVLIGNGFDLAHGLKTSYADFIDWYWDYRMRLFSTTYSSESKDVLCSFKTKTGEDGPELWSTIAYSHSFFRSTPALGIVYVGKNVIKSIIDDKEHFETKFSPLFEKIIKGVESKTWGGIEQDYYDLLKEYAFRDPNVNSKTPPIKALNKQLRYIQEKLVEYLKEVSAKKVDKIESIENAIYAPINPNDLSTTGWSSMQSHINVWASKSDETIIEKNKLHGRNQSLSVVEIKQYRDNDEKGILPKAQEEYPEAFMLPNSIMLLDFNYTDTTSKYIKPAIATINHIHGYLSDPQSIIFGYGDELDDKFKELKEHKNNACLSHIKSIKYLEAPNYRKMLSFIESGPFQVLIMGHSCDNSDRTLLNTIIEHPNCVSIKPYYYITDEEKQTNNYTELAQHISRNFNDMKLMRDRVVNKTQCEPLVHN